MGDWTYNSAKKKKKKEDLETVWILLIVKN